MANALLRKSYYADTAIPAFTPVKIGSDKDHVTPCTAVSDVCIGMTGAVTAATGDQVDVTVSGIEFGTAGASFSAGARLTVNGSSLLVTAAPSAGVNNCLVGVAMEPATASGDQVNVLLTPGVTIQG